MSKDFSSSARGDQNYTMEDIVVQVAQLTQLQRFAEEKIDHLTKVVEELKDELRGTGDKNGLVGRVSMIEHDLQQLGPTLHDISLKLEQLSSTQYTCRYQNEITRLQKLLDGLNAKKEEEEEDEKLITWKWFRDKIGTPALMLFVGWLFFNVLPKLIAHLGASGAIP